MAITPSALAALVGVEVAPAPSTTDPAHGGGRHPTRLELPRAGRVLPDIATVVDAACGTGTGALLVPDSFGWGSTATGVPRLLSAEFDPADEGAWHALLTLALPGACWEAITGVVTLHDPVVKVFVPAGRPPSITLRTDLRLLDSLELRATIAVTRNEAGAATFALDAGLAPGQSLPLGATLASMSLALPGTEALTVRELRCGWATGDEAVEIGITLGDVWSPGWGDGTFALAEVAMRVSIPLSTDGEGHRQLDGQVAGQMHIGPATVDALFTNQDGGWRAELDVLFEPPLALHDAAVSLTSSLGLDGIAATLPDLGGLTVEAASIDVDMESHAATMSLTSSGSWDPTWLPGFSIDGLALTVTHEPVGESATSTTDLAASGTIELDGTQIPVAFAYDGRHGGWTMSATYAQDWTLAEVVDALPEALGLGADAIPLPLDTVHVTTTAIRADSAAGRAAIKLTGVIALVDGGAAADRPHFTLSADLTTAPDGSRRVALAGSIMIGTLEFALEFMAEQHAFVGSYATHAGADDDIGTLVATLTGQPPFHVGFGIRDAVLVAAHREDASGHDMLFAIDVDGGMDLSALPLVSKVLSPSDGLQVAFQARWAARAFPHDELESYQTLLPHGAPPLVAEDSSEGVEAGPALLVHIRIAGTAFDLGWNIDVGGEEEEKEKTEAGGDGDAPALVAAGPDQPMHWFDVQKALGPLRVDRFGVGLDVTEQQVVAVVDADLTMGALTLSTHGLGATYDLADHDLGFALDGIGVAYDGGPTSISGTLLRIAEDAFAGEALLRTPTFGLSALGSYTTIGGDPSMFVEAFLDKPLGGPPFAFVTGLAAGFGFNRLLADVELAELPKHPFIVQAMGTETQPSPPQSPSDTRAALDASLRKLDAYVVPKAGEYFLAIGVKFTTFKVIDSFALAVARFGRHFTLDVLGLSTAVLPPRPPDAPPDPSAFKLAVVQMALDARLDPDAGLFRVDAILTDESWVLSKDCHLTGGFAFATWFAGEHSGDFVTSIGGYHPDYKIPVHYPRPDRLTLSWQVCDEVDISGDCYFALTPNNLMAGGHLQAHWHTGDLWASFSVGADFLMQWKPFHYIASAGIEISAGYGSLSGSVGADLTLWGPDFTGTARVHLGPFISFDVHFGDADPAPAPLTWTQFSSAFLPPQDDDLVHVAPMSGVVRSLTEPDDDGAPTARRRWVVNPKEFVIQTTSLVPLSHIAFAEGHNDDVADIDLTGAVPTGVAPMNRTDVPTMASLEVAITLGAERIDHDFVVAPAPRAFPAALWGTQGHTADLDGGRTADALGTTLIRPRHPAAPGATAQIRRGNLRFLPHLVTPPPDPELLEAARADASHHRGLSVPRTAATRAADRATVAASNTRAAHDARTTLLTALGFRPDHDVRLPANPADDLVGAPRVAPGRPETAAEPAQAAVSVDTDGRG